MARGWESKEVESQIESAVEERGRKRPDRVLTADEVAREREREGLEHARDRVTTELANPHLHPRHRAMLESALADLDARLDGGPR